MTRAALYAWGALLALALVLLPFAASADPSGASSGALGNCRPGRNCKAKTFKATTSSGTAVSIPQGIYLALDGSTPGSTPSWAVFGDGVEIVFRTNSLNRSWVSASGFVTTQSFTSSVGSGSNGFACSTNGCRIDLGTGANDYLFGDGTQIQTPGNFVASGSVYSSSTVYHGATGAFRNSSNAAPTTLGSLRTAASVTSTAPAVLIKPDNALDANDLVLDVESSSTTPLLSVDQEGDVTTGGGLTVNGTAVANAYAGAGGTKPSVQSLGTIIYLDSVPTCDASTRGLAIVTPVTGGLDDVCFCRFNAAGSTYSWKDLTGGACGS